MFVKPIYCYDNIRKDVITDTARMAPKDGCENIVKLATAQPHRLRQADKDHFVAMLDISVLG